MSTLSAYCDRLCPPQETLDRIAPHLAGYGITRLARQTALDIIGIPVFASFRPNAMTLATNQGKGLTDAAAKASAAMEAIEFAIAERPECDVVLATAAELAAQGHSIYCPTGTMPTATVFPADTRLHWVKGRDIFGHNKVLVPLDLVRFSARASDLPGICQHTNGLASGNSVDEALFHGLCEIIERDAGTLWALASPGFRAGRRIDPAAFNDPNVDELAGKIAAAGLRLRLFDQTSDLGIPTVMAEIAPPAGDAHARHFDMSSGSGTHPVAIRAAIRAITEAAQSRVTAIAAARDDIDPDDYTTPGESNPAEASATHIAPTGAPLGTPLPDLIALVKAKLAQAGILNVLCVPLGGEAAGVAVVKVLAEGVEDWGVNLNWRPGPRALSAMLGASL